MVPCVISFDEQVSNEVLEYIIIYSPVLLNYTMSFVRLPEFIERWLGWMEVLHINLHEISGEPMLP
jgi:hypothetical protein